MNLIGQQLIPRALRGARSLQSPVELTACPPKYGRNLHMNYVPPNLPVALMS